jgi:hypothetical protein
MNLEIFAIFSTGLKVWQTKMILILTKMGENIMHRKVIMNQNLSIRKYNFLFA